MSRPVYISLDDAAAMLGVDRLTVLRLMAAGALPSAEFGLVRRVLLSAVTARLATAAG